MNKIKNVLLFSMLLGLCVSLGCDQAANAVKEEAAKAVPTIGDVIGEVKKMVGLIGDGMSKGDQEGLDAAHGPLHEIGHKLEALPALLDASDLADEAKTSAKGAVESLMDAFGKIDAKLHGAADGADYADVKDSIDSALATLLEQTNSLTK